MRPIWYLAAVSVITTASCNGGTEPDSLSGSMSVVLSGAMNEEFAAEGPLPTGIGSNNRLRSHAAALSGEDSTDLFLDGTRAHHDNLRDYLIFQIPDYQGTGAYTPQGVLSFQVSRQTRWTYDIVVSELRITEASEDRIRGTFTGIAVTFPPFVGSPPDTIRLTNGSFDVAVHHTGGTFALPR